jgi:hypothetical protein
VQQRRRLAWRRSARPWEKIIATHTIAGSQLESARRIGLRSSCGAMTTT